MSNKKPIIYNYSRFPKTIPNKKKSETELNNQSNSNSSSELIKNNSANSNNQKK